MGKTESQVFIFVFCQHFDRGIGRDITSVYKFYGIDGVFPGSRQKALPGTVYCMCPAENKMREMAYGGFEKKRGTLKYKCPANNYGYECRGKKKCNVNAAIRIPLEEDRRIFTPIARSSYKWKRIYKMRTSVERVNSRIDNVFKFENHKLRGIKKVSLKLLLSFCVLLALAKGRIENKQKEKMTQFLKAG